MKNLITTKNEQKHLVYRPDIDGLRALAVLSVLFFHVGFYGFPGGFVGVDIFFVISGFLITRLIVTEIEVTGTFCFGHFYLRRARRLFPALFVTLFTCAIISFLLFSPGHLERFGGALLHAIASLSNFYFWAEADYFDATANVKPLLHTWSLAVEEQFYLIWPVMIFILSKFGREWLLVICLVFLACISLVLNQIFGDGQVLLLDYIQSYLPNQFVITEWFYDGYSTVFYLLPFRVFEFAIGAGLVWTSRWQQPKNIIREICLLFGFVLILYSVFTFNADMLFPGLVALVPCIGTALMLYGGEAKYLGLMLRNQLIVFIGLISYSLYLVHWPLIVFWKYYTFKELILFEMFIILILSFLLAVLMYHYVEQPYRRSRLKTTEKVTVDSGTFSLGMFALTLLLVVPASWMNSNNGWVWRLGDVQAAQFELIRSDKFKESEYGGRVGKQYMYGLQFNEAFPERTPNILTLGDSHAQQYLSGLMKEFPSMDIAHLDNRCRFSTIEYCIFGQWSGTRHFEYKLAQLEYLKQADYSNTLIILSQVWTKDKGQSYPHYNEFTDQEKQFDFTEEYVDFLVEGINKVNKTIQPKMMAVIGQVPSAASKQAPLDCLSRPLGLKAHCVSRSLEKTKGIIEFNQLMEDKLAIFPGIEFVNPIDYLCNTGECISIIEGKLIYSDGSHLTKWGSEFMINSLNKKFKYYFKEE